MLQFVRPRVNAALLFIWRKRAMVQPIHIITLGLVIALVGVAWLIYRGPKVITVTGGVIQTATLTTGPLDKDKTIADLRAQIDALKGGAAAGATDISDAVVIRADKDATIADLQARLNEANRRLSGVQTPSVATPSKPHIYSDTADAKEALENLHDIMVKRIQPAIVIFPRFDILQRSLRTAITSRFNTADRPGQIPKPDLKEVRTGTIRNFLDNQLSAILNENTKLGDAQKAIYEIRAKQKAITASKTDEFFALAYPPQPFADAQSDLVVALRYFIKQDTLDNDAVETMKANYALFEIESTKFSTQITDAIRRIVEEISAIEH